MAKRSRQSILKRQREVKKAEKAEAKRQKRLERRQKDDQNPDESGPPIDYAAPETQSDDATEREAPTLNGADSDRRPAEEA